MMQPHKLLMTMVMLAMALYGKTQKTERKIHSVSAIQAIDLALKHRAEILNARLDIDNQVAFNKEITGLALPQVAGNIAAFHNFNIPVTVLPDFISPSVYGVLEDNGVKDGNGNPIKWDGIINTFPAQFGVPWQASLSASVKQILFQPDVFIALKARSAAVELYENQLNVAVDSVKSNVYNTYFGVLVSEKGLEFASESQLRLKKLLKEQQELFKNGFIEKLDIEKTQVNLNNISTSVIRLENMVATSYAGLKFALALPQLDSLHLTDELTEEWVKRDIFDMSNDFKYDQRPEIKTLETTEELQTLQVRRYKMAGLPTIAAQWNVGTSAQRQRLNFLDTGDRWFYSNTLGVNLSVPITDGFQRHNRVKQAEYTLEKTRNTKKQFEQYIDFQVMNARISLTNAIAAYNNQQENKELAEKVFNTTRIKYEQGLGSSFEVLQAENDLQVALNNYYSSLYGAGIARIAYMRALGKL